MTKKSTPRRTPRKSVRAKDPAAKPDGSVASQVPDVNTQQEEQYRARFVQGVMKRGEAVPKGQPLPPGATHVITGKDSEGKPLIERKRFSLR